MAKTILLKSNQDGDIPDPGDPLVGEIALDTYNGEIYMGCKQGGDPGDDSDVIRSALMKHGGTIEGDLTVQGGEASSGTIYLSADQGDDNSDKWKIAVAISGGIEFSSYSTGAWVGHFASKSDGRLSGGSILDQDDMADDDAFRLATQQSIKAYVDETKESIMVHNFYISSTAVNYIPFGGSQTETTSTAVGYTDDQVFIAPYDGKITKVLLYNDYSSTATPGATTVSMGKNGALIAVLNNTTSFSWAYQTTLDYIVNANNTFSKGDVIRLAIDTTSTARYVTMTTVWQYDRTT